MFQVSIVTLSFNQIGYLKPAMESVLAQDYPALEYIVVDAGSTDGSRELIESYGCRIARRIFERDKGAADGLNKGFALATGEIFGFLNSDDILLPGSLERVADYFHRHPECDLVMGNGYVTDSSGARLRHVRARRFTARRYFCGGSRFLQQSTFFRREAFLRSPRFNPSNQTCWDGELFVHMVKQGGRVGYLPADLAEFRIHESSISGSGRMNHVYRNDMERIFRDVTGRNRNLLDGAWRLAYRAEALGLRIAEQFGPEVKN